MGRHGNNKIIKTFKDYMVPIIGVLLVSIIILNIITSSSNNKVDVSDNTIGNINVSLNDGSSAFLVFNSGKKEEIKSDIVLSKSEKLLVKSGSLNVSLPSGIGSFVLDEMSDFKYKTDGGYSLLGGNLWLDSNSNFDIDLKYLTVSTNPGTIVSLEQNEIVSNVYVISGSVNVKNLAGISTDVSAGKKISVLRTQGTDKNIDLSTLITDIPEYFKEDRWFKDNNGDMLLSGNNGKILNETNTGMLLSVNTNYIEFTDLEDEDEFQTNTIDIEGNILDDNISKITFGGIEAELYKDSNTFIIKNFELNNKVNDIVYKIYNEDDDVIKKAVITLYNTKASSTNTNSTLTVENYPMDSSVFKFVSPKKNPYTTTDKLVRIDGTVPVGKVKFITVNGYKLKKFPEFGANWYYFANVGYGNLKEGLNIYKVKYFDKDDKLLFTNTFTVIKEKNILTNKYSDEAKIN